MKKPYDLHLHVPLDDFELTGKMIKKAAELGYSGIGVPLPPNVSNETVSMLHNICASSKIDLVRRIDLASSSVNKLLSQLRRFRRRFEVVSVTCRSKTVARQAAKDRRVDLVSFPLIGFQKSFFDHAEAELATSALASLEIDMVSLLLATGFERTRLMSNFRKEVNIAKKFQVPVVISSGAKNFTLMRKPQDLAALAFLFDMPPDFALNAISKNSVSIVARNRTKLLPSFVAPGLRVVRRGKDCEE
jgi:ribonuclease P/MRP protein subunit RPP1